MLEQLAINWVCTRCTNGDHDGLTRWYNDHAQLLLASPQLLRAQLYRVTRADARIAKPTAPDYFCLYHFARLDDFAAFDSGAVMNRVRTLSNAAPGRASVDIVKRTQYVSLLNRQFEHSAPTAGVEAVLLTSATQDPAELVRWLNDVLYELSRRQQMASAQAYWSQQAQGGELLLILSMNHSPAADWYLASSPFAKGPSLDPVWALSAQPLAAWLR